MTRYRRSIDELEVEMVSKAVVRNDWTGVRPLGGTTPLLAFLGGGEGGRMRIYSCTNTNVTPPPCPPTLLRRHTHTVTHTVTHTLSHTHCHTHCHTHTVTHTLSHTQCHTHTVTHTLSHTHTVTHTLSHTHSVTHTLSHTHCHTHTG